MTPPLPGQAPSGKAYDVALMKRLWQFVVPHKPLLALSLLIIPCTIGFELAQPAVIRYVVEHHLSPLALAGLWLPCLALAGLICLHAAASYFEQWAIQMLGQRTMHSMRLAVYDHVMTQRTAFFDKVPVGRLMTRMTNDIENINEMFASGVVTLVADAIKMLAILGVLLVINWKLALLTFTTLPLLVILVEWSRRAMRRSFRAIRVKLAAMNGYLQEHLQGIRVVHLLGRQRRSLAEFNQLSAAHRDAYLDSIKADAVMYALVEAISVIAIALVAWWATRGRADGPNIVMQVGLVAVFIEYANKFFIPVRDLSAKYAVMQGAMAALERITGLLDQDEPDCPSADVPTAGKPTPAAIPSPTAPCLQLEDVHFGYGAEPILRGVSFSVPRGQTVAIVGKTGSGKSTIIKLLTRQYEPTSGLIALTGQPIVALPPAELRRRVTVIAQDPAIFSTTIRENLQTDDRVCSDAEMQVALTQVGLWPLLERRCAAPLDLAVVERGANLSSGERQLLAFARALLRNPEVLILDEATAHVDPGLEGTIEASIGKLSVGRTTIVIAHRLSTVRRADRIIVLEGGSVAEEGAHDALVSAQGLYARLAQSFAGANRQPLPAAHN